jgi:hypothetical protein
MTSPLLNRDERIARNSRQTNLRIASHTHMTSVFDLKLGRSAVGLASVLMAVFSGVASADADTWYGIDQDVGRSVLYVNPASITRDGDTRDAWLLKDYRDPQPTRDGTKQLQSIEELVAVHCADSSYARKQVVEYSGTHASGTSVGSYAFPAGEQYFEKAVPLTQSQAVVDAICHAAP